MRCLVSVLLLSGAAAPEDPLLLEERHWRGVIEVESASAPPPLGAGGETQTEKVEFRLVTRPPRRAIAWPRLVFEQRQTSGSWRLAVDMREGEEQQAVTTRGEGRGRLHVRVSGYVEPTRRRYRLDLRVMPERLVARTTASGMHENRFTTWRDVAARPPLLDRFSAEGETGEGARVLTGTRTLVDRRARLKRDVTIRWRVERVDPSVRGRVVDHDGRPVPAMQVLAWTTNPERARKRLPPIRRGSLTDKDGRFEIDAFWAHWNVRIEGFERDGIVYAGKEVEDGARLERTGVPDLEIEIEAYRHRDLPWARLLKGHFQGKVDEYLAHVRERVSARRLMLARTR